MADLREAPERVKFTYHPALTQWAQTLPDSLNTVEYLRADLAQQERDAAVAAALGAAQEQCVEIANEPRHFKPEQMGARMCRTAIANNIPRNDAALRLHEARVIRELADRVERGTWACTGCNEDVARSLRAEAEEREQV